MKKESVPQDNNKTYQGYGTKVMYAVDEAGRYTTVKSSGWEAEEIVLRDVVEEFRQKAEAARQRALAGQASPIEYFMLKKMMDPAGLASGVGFVQWRVKRHLTCKGFQRLDRAILKRYADFFNIDLNVLTHFKEHV